MRPANGSLIGRVGRRPLNENKHAQSRIAGGVSLLLLTGPLAGVRPVKACRGAGNR
jgi:hypothetical protein